MAFYIAYVTVTGKEDLTTEALASQVGLRRNTVWNFRNKVADRVLELQKRGKRPDASRWEEIIFLREVRSGVSFHADSREKRQASIATAGERR